MEDRSYPSSKSYKRSTYTEEELAGSRYPPLPNSDRAVIEKVLSELLENCEAAEQACLCFMDQQEDDAERLKASEAAMKAVEGCADVAKSIVGSRLWNPIDQGNSVQAFLDLAKAGVITRDLASSPHMS